MRIRKVGHPVVGMLFCSVLLLVSQCAEAQSTTAQSPQPSEESALRQAVLREPSNPLPCAALGAFYLRKERWSEGARWMRKAHELAPENEAIAIDLATALMQSGELEQAAALTREMLAQKESEALHRLMASVDERKGDTLEALREYHRAAELDPSESNIFDLALFLINHKKYVGFTEESLKFFRYGVDKYPHSSRLMVGLGVALYAAEQYDDAVKTLCAAVDLDPKDRRPVEFLGKARKVSPDLADEVDRRLKDFAERYPDSAAIDYYYALSLWDRGGGREGNGLDKIESLLRKATSRVPQWYEPHYQLGIVLESEMHYTRAIEELRRATCLEPGFSPAHFHLAVLYKRTGDQVAAAREGALVREIKDKDRVVDTAPLTVR